MSVGIPLTALLGALCLPAAGCKDGGEFQVYASEYQDVYVQEPVRALDVLFVIDSSGSMEGEQVKLSTNFQAFIEAFVTAEVNYHIGVVTTDVADVTEAGRLRALPLKPGETPPVSGILPPAILSPESEDAEAAFETLVQVGTFGSGLEMGMEAARLALSPPLIDGHNAGFYRQDAALAVVIVSDEDDLSPYPVDDYLNFFATLKGGDVYREPTTLTVSAIVGDLPGGCTAAEDGDVSVAGPGFRYVDAASRTSGVFASICAADYAPVVEGLGLDLSGLSAEFGLSYCAKAESLQVYVGDALQTLGDDYVYDPAQRLIRFANDAIPPPQATITISYEFYPDNRFTCPDA